MQLLFKQLLKFKNDRVFLIYFLIFFQAHFLFSQTFFPADNAFLINHEAKQFSGFYPIQSNFFRPVFYPTDSSIFEISIKNEFYLNDNAPNQENMDVRYFSKGFNVFNSMQIMYNSEWATLFIEPYFISNKHYSINKIERKGAFSVLNDNSLSVFNSSKVNKIRNFIAFIHYKGIGIGINNGNKWWGPGIHNSLQMSNNTYPINTKVMGTMKEIRIGKLGIYGTHSFAKLDNYKDFRAKYLTSLNMKISYYGSTIFSLGVSRNFLTGGIKIDGYQWNENDANKIVFENFLTSNLIRNEYTIGGHDAWDQTLSGYISAIFPTRKIKTYAEIGFNDNRMYFADLISQPDHSMATIIGIRDYGAGKNKKILWGFEWTNLMITYSSRHRIAGPGTWYNKDIYNYSSYLGRRWAAHSGTDSDDWYVYMGYYNKNFIILPAINYERHGIVSHRPAEIKIEGRLDIKYFYKKIWFGIYYEKQFEAFLGFPDFYYVDNSNKAIDSSRGRLANTRYTNTLIFSLSKNIQINLK